MYVFTVYIAVGQPTSSIFWCYVSTSKYLAEFYCLALSVVLFLDWGGGYAKQELAGMYLVLKMDEWL